MSDRICAVTGANRGTGRELARQLAASSDTVILTARDPEKARTAADSLAGTAGEVIPHQLDITDPGSIEQLTGFIAERWRRVDVLVNNAAIHYDTSQNATTADLRIVREALKTNVLGAWQTTQALLPLLRASKRGRVVNVSSEGGSLTNMGGGTPAYPSLTEPRACCGRSTSPMTGRPAGSTATAATCLGNRKGTSR